jgi:hypothetical protein
VVLLASLVGSGVAAADSVCIARPGSAMDAPRALAGDGARALGSLEHRRCYSVMQRLDRHTRIWVGAEDGFQGEVEVSNDVLAHVLTDDVDMILEPGGDVFGKALSGALVLVAPHPDPELWRATLVEGRLSARFLVAGDDVYPAQSWPLPDPDEGADSDWPAADLPLPPFADGLLDDPTGMQLRGQLRAPLARLDDLRHDPALGQLRMVELERRDDARKVRLVGPTAWAEGWVLGSGWLEDPPSKGWDPLAGFSPASAATAGARQVGSKVAPLHLSAKGTRVGALQAGTRVAVLADHKSWLEVRANWNGGQVTGWLEKKRLVKEGKEGPLRVRVEPLSSVFISRVALQWRIPEDHREELPVEPPAEAEAPVDPAAEPGATSEPAEPPEPPERKTVIPPPTLGLDAATERMSRSMARLQWLYAQGLAATPGLRGDITVRLLVEPSGAVTEHSIFASTLADEAIHAVIESDIADLVFEKRRLPRRKRGEPRRDWRIVVWIQYALQPVLP